jgi:hypothetical protein
MIAPMNDSIRLTSPILPKRNVGDSGKTKAGAIVTSIIPGRF